MRYGAEHKGESRERLIESAGRAFREHGYGGVGVDGLAKGARLTSGAFYVHFPSKMAAFEEVVRSGLESLRAGIVQFRTEGRRQWLSRFARFYMTERRTCDVGDSCALAALGAEVERVSGEARQIFEVKLKEVADEMAAGLSGSPAERRRQAWAVLAMLSGGVTMARAVCDPALAKEVATAVQTHIKDVQAAGSHASPEA